MNDDRTLVALFVDKVNRAAGEAHAVLYGFFLHMKSGKCRQQCRVNVHDAVGIGAHEYGRKEPHKTGKHNQFYFPGAQNIDHRLVKSLSAGKSLVIQNLDWNPVFFGPHEAIGIGCDC